MTATSQEMSDILSEIGQVATLADRQRQGLSSNSAIEVLQIIRKDKLIAALTAVNISLQQQLAKMP